MAGRALVGKANRLNKARHRREAEQAAREAIALLAAGRDRRLLADAWNELGVALWFLDGGPGAALEAFTEARKIAEAVLDNDRQLVRLLDSEALCLNALERYDAAAALQVRALQAADAGGLAGHARQLRRRMANAAMDQGHFTRAARLLSDARPPSRASVEERVGWLHSNALLAERRDRQLEAERWYDRATALLETKATASPDQVACLTNAAMLKSDMDGHAQARRLLAAAAALAPPDPPISYYVKRAVADAVVAARSGDIDAASRFMEEARAKARERNAGSRAYELDIVAFHADLLSGAGRFDDAQALLESAIFPADGKDGFDPAGFAVALALAELLLARGHGTDFAERLLRWIFSSGVAPGETEWRVLTCLADLAAARGASARSIFFGKVAVARLMASLEPFPAESYRRDAVLRRREQPYLDLFSRLIRAGRIVEAGRIRTALTAERAFNLAGRTGPAGQTEYPEMFGDRELVWLEQYENALANIRAIEERAADPGLSAGERDALVAEHAAAGQALLAIFAEAMKPDAGRSGRAPLPDAAGLTRPVESGTAILRYYLGEAGWTVALSRVDAEERIDLVASPDEVAGIVFDLLELTRRGASAVSQARSLYRHLLEPAEAFLDGVSHIEVLADGALASLPFCALHDGEGFLIERFEFAYRSAAGVRAARPSSVGRVVFFGASKPWHGLAALPHVGGEIEGAARAFPRASRHIDRNFTGNALRAALAGRNNAVHIASHYHLVPGSPTRSFLLLGNGERMPISAFLSEEYDWSETALLFLSACESMAGDTSFDGASTLAAALHLRGVDAFVASIWPVADASTAALVSRFYAGAASGLGVAAALRDAQRSLLAGASAANAWPSAADHGHPMHWAPFKLFVPGS